MDGSLSLNELQAKYSSPEFLDRLVELRTIADFLERSIVLESYEPSPKLLSAIGLTDSGNTMLRRLIGKDKPLAVRGPSIAALFLTMFADELYIDPLATGIDAIVEQISTEIRKEQIRYPYIYGRVLYDRAFEKLRRNKRILSSKETLELLEGTPIGVFQLGAFISGPYGLLRSCERRISPPDFLVPLYHCDDLSCDVLHETYLTTGQSKVSKARTRLGEISERDDVTPGEWSALLREHSSKEVNPFSWSFSSGLVSLLGDAFTLAEMKLVLADLLDSTGGSLRNIISSAINVSIRDAEGFVDGVSEAQALQLILLCSDDQITDSLNALILQGRIFVPRTEVRNAIMAPEYSGYFGLIPQCTALGVRFATSGSLTLLRVRHLVSEMFDTSDDQEKERLAWLTRSSSGANFQEQLSKFICHQDLEAAVQALIFDSGKKLDVAARFAGIGTSLGLSPGRRVI